MDAAGFLHCFRCGRPVGEPPAINELPDGRPCPACAERLLESLPPIFHAPMPFVLASHDPRPDLSEDEDLGSRDGDGGLAG